MEITLQIWHILLLITIISFIVMINAEDKFDGYFSLEPIFAIAYWLFGNLIMWLIYFVIV